MNTTCCDRWSRSIQNCQQCALSCSHAWHHPPKKKWIWFSSSSFLTRNSRSQHSAAWKYAIIWNSSWFCDFYNFENQKKYLDNSIFILYLHMFFSSSEIQSIKIEKKTLFTKKNSWAWCWKATPNSPVLCQNKIKLFRTEIPGTGTVCWKEIRFPCEKLIPFVAGRNQTVHNDDEWKKKRNNLEMLEMCTFILL